MSVERPFLQPSLWSERGLRCARGLPEGTVSPIGTMIPMDTMSPTGTEPHSRWAAGQGRCACTAAIPGY